MGLLILIGIAGVVVKSVKKPDGQPVEDIAKTGSATGVPKAEGGSTNPATSNSLAPPPRLKQVGELVLSTRTPIISGASAWVEVNGKKATSWAVGTSQVSLTLASGEHKVGVISVYRGVRRVIYDSRLSIPSGGDSLRIDVGP